MRLRRSGPGVNRWRTTREVLPDDPVTAHVGLEEADPTPGLGHHQSSIWQEVMDLDQGVGVPHNRSLGSRGEKLDHGTEGDGHNRSRIRSGG